MRKTTSRWHVLGCLLLFAPSGCTSDGGGTQLGGHTNWLPCEELADCSEQPGATECKDGYCTDSIGRPVEVRAPARGADAGIDSMDASSPSQQRDDASGPSETRRDAASTDTGTKDAGAQDASGADASAQEAGTAPDAVVGGQACGPRICGPGSHCCDACLGVCIPEGSGAFCPGGTPGTLCSDGGLAELRIPECPGPMGRCASERCRAGMDCVTCSANQVCIELDLSCGPAGGSSAQCVDWPCGEGTLTDACVDAVCRAVQPSGLFAVANAYRAGYPLRSGDAPFIGCAGGGVCAAPNTPIATPHGEVAIAELRAGDLVYSMHQGELRAVPLVSVARTPVFDHRVVQLVLDDGAQLEISAPHPLADGRALGVLRAGDLLDGHTIVAWAMVDYPYAYTHDILPASDSGTYLAAGVWLGSTLHGRSADR